MARPQKISDETIIKLLNEYVLQNPNKDIKTVDFGQYLRSHGYQIEDYTLRRRKEVQSAIDNINAANRETLSATVPVWQQLDPVQFLANNPSRESLIKALTVRDNYYGQIAALANTYQQKVKELTEENTQLRYDNKHVRKVNAEAQERADSLSADVKEKDETIRKLKKILKDYVYPDIATQLLHEAGISETVSRVADSEKTIQQLIDPNTPVQAETPDAGEADSNTQQKAASTGDPAVDALLSGFGGEDGNTQ